MAQKNCVTMNAERGHHCSSRRGARDFCLPCIDRWWSDENADGSLHQSSAPMPKHRLSDGEPQSILHAAWWWPRHPPKCQGLLRIFWCGHDLDEFLVQSFFFFFLPLLRCQCTLFTKIVISLMELEWNFVMANLTTHADFLPRYAKDLSPLRKVFVWQTF